MNCAKKLLEPTNFFNFYTPSHHKILVPKSVAQEKLKSCLEFRNQIIVSSIRFRKKGFVKFLILIALFKKFLSKQFIASVKVSNMARFSNKTNELRDIDSLGHFSF